MQKAIREHAQKLIRDHGGAAFDKAQEAVSMARRRRNSRLEAYLSKVAREVARQAPTSAR